MDDFQTELKRVQTEIDRLLDREEMADGLRPPVLAEATAAYPHRGGKRLRPALVFWACGAAGGRPDQARYVALAVELFHCWTLVHDDIIDRDDVRRGGRTCHVLAAETVQRELAVDAAVADALGSAIAILAGDVQQAWALHALLRSREDGVPEEVVLLLLQDMTGWVTPALISGEALDVIFAHRPDPTPEEIEEMMSLKTGVLLEFAGAAGVVVGLRRPARDDVLVRSIRRFARSLGLAFQLQDDLLGVFGDRTSVGKPIGSDIREGKRTMLYVEAMRTGDAHAQHILARSWGNPNLSLNDVNEVRSVLEATGAVERVRRRILVHLADALCALEAFPESRYRRLLEAWARFAVTRQV